MLRKLLRLRNTCAPFVAAAVSEAITYRRWLFTAGLTFSIFLWLGAGKFGSDDVGQQRKEVLLPASQGSASIRSTGSGNHKPDLEGSPAGSNPVLARLETKRRLQSIQAATKSPQDEAASASNFLRTNAEATKGLRLSRLTEEEKNAAQLALAAHLQARVDANPDDLAAQANLMLLEIRQKAKTPEEIVTQTAEFLKLNQETLQAYLRAKSTSNSIQ